MDTVISIIIPLYNAEKYIAQCIDSVLSQTIDQNLLEIIVVDDKSTDRSFDLVSNKYGNLKNIKIIQNKCNYGVGFSRNCGIQNAKGKYIATIDADDFVDNNFLEVLFDSAEANKADIVSMGYKNFVLDDAGHWIDKNVVNIVDKLRKLENNLNIRIINMCKKRYIANIWCKLLRTDFLRKNNLFIDNLRIDDVLFHFKLLYYAKTYILLPDNLYHFRQTEASITRGTNNEKPLIALREIFSVMDYLTKYIYMMPEILSDRNLKDLIYTFFYDVLLGSYFINICNGNFMSNVKQSVDIILAEKFGNNNFFINYLFDKFLDTKFNVKK